MFHKTFTVVVAKTFAVMFGKTFVVMFAKTFAVMFAETFVVMLVKILLWFWQHIFDLLFPRSFALAFAKALAVVSAEIFVMFCNFLKIFCSESLCFVVPVMFCRDTYGPLSSDPRISASVILLIAQNFLPRHA